MAMFRLQRYFVTCMDNFFLMGRLPKHHLQESDKNFLSFLNVSSLDWELGSLS